MGTILAIPDDGERLMRVSFGDRLLGIYRSYRKGVECVYAEWGKVVLQLAGQPILLQKWRLWFDFWATKIG